MELVPVERDVALDIVDAMEARHGRFWVGMDVRLACLVPWIHTLDTNTSMLDTSNFFDSYACDDAFLIGP